MFGGFQRGTRITLHDLIVPAFENVLLGLPHAV